ncbi:MAG: site-specific DNA-methyltransferase [Paludibacteraceae bacterium]|nr:site-specific DNA-methyltransferase [Paludibacteraceae bacterium]
MENLKMQTTNVVDDNIKKIGDLFPNCLTEMLDENGRPQTAIDFDQLRQELSKDIVEGPEERYQFTWPDKRNAIRLANAPTTDTLRPCREESVDFDNTQNLYIEGDNLQVLKLLRENYLGKVKMIYIDPPYNTGKDFLYNDDYKIEQENYLQNSGQVNEEGQMLIVNQETNGRYHTDWLNMIYPRLKVAKDLLAKDGVIFISIDEHEVENLKKICLEVFGVQTYVGTLVLQTATDNNPGQVKIEHEYILCLCRDKKLSGYWYAEKEEAKFIQDKYEELKSKYGFDTETIQTELRGWIKKNKDKLKGITHYDNVDSRGVFHDGDIANTVFGGYEYDIIHPKTGKACKMPEKGYRFPEETMVQMLKSDDIMFGEDERTLPKPKIRLEDAKDMLRSVIYEDGRSSTKHFESLMARDIFQNPKSETILSRLINFICKDGDIVLDFFSGSGTTAEAVMLSELKNINLSFILVQLKENLDETIKTATSKGKKTIQNAIKFLDSIGKIHTIPEIGKERIRRAGKKIRNENPEAKNLDTGFRVLKLDSSNMQDVYYTPSEFNEQKLFDDNIKPDRTEEDLLFQTMIELGIELSAKIEKRSIAGKTVWSVSDGYLMACFDEDVNETTITEIARQHPYYFVMRDSSLANDQVADNFEQIWEEYSKDTVRRIL